jgi:hypothetical protein
MGWGFQVLFESNLLNSSAEFMYGLDEGAVLSRQGFVF